jgi:hypothetical protein
MKTIDPPKNNETTHTSPVTTVIALTLGGPGVKAELFWPRLNVADGNPPVACEPPLRVAATVCCGCPVKVWVTAAPVAVAVALGMLESEMAIGFEEVALKFVSAIPIWLLVRSYTTYADRKKVSPKR